MKNIHVLPTDKPSRLRYNLSNVLVLTKEPYRDYSKQVNQHIYITSDEEIKEGDWFHLDMSHSDTLPDELHQMGNNRWSKTGGIHFCEGNTWVKSCKKIILTTDQDLIKDGVQEIDDEFLEWFVKNPSCEEVETYHIGYVNAYNIIIPKEEPKQVFTKGDKVLYSGKLLNEEVVDKLVTVFYTLGRGGITDMSDIIDEYTHIYRVWNKDLKHLPKEEPKQETLVEKMIPLQLKYNLDMMKQETLEEDAERLYQKGLQDDLGLSFYDGVKFGADWQQERMYSEDDMKEAIRFGFDKGFCSNSSNKTKNKGLSEQEWFEQFKKQ